MRSGDTNQKLRALTLAAMMLFAVVPAPAGAELLAGGNASVSQVGNAPGVVVDDATIYSGNSSTVEVAYDASGSATSAGNLTVVLRDGNDDVIAVNDSLGAEGLSGVAEVTIAGGRVSDISTTVQLYDNKVKLADDSATISVTQFYTAPWVNQTDQSYDPSTKTTLKIPYNVTGVVGSSSDLRFELVDSDGNTVDSNTSLSSLSGNVTLDVSAGRFSGDTSLTLQMVDTSGPTLIATDSFTLTDSGGGPPGGGSFSIDDIDVVDQNVAPGTSATINVTVNNTDSSSGSQKVSIYHLDPTAQSVSEINNTTVTVSANSNKTVSLEVSFSTAGSKRLGVFAGTFNRTELLVQPSSSITVNSFSASETTVEQNEDVTLTTTVENTGSSEDSTLVPLYRDGKVIRTKNVTVPANSQKQITINTSFRKTGSYSLKVGSTSAKTITIEKRGAASVANTTLTVVGGTQPTSDLTVKTKVDPTGSRLRFNIKDPGSSDPGDLASAGVDPTTQFKVVLTVENFTSRIVMGLGQELTWANEPGPGQTTNVTFYVQPLAAQRITNTSVGKNNWPSNAKDVANIGRKAMVAISSFSMRNAPGSVRSRLNGATIATNAQLFTRPKYQQGTQNRGPRLRVFVAGPNRTVNNNQYDGSYEAIIPDGILNTWGVNDAGQLRAAYQGSQTQATFTDTPKGIKMSLDIHYSTGNVDVKAGSSDTTAPSASVSSSSTSITAGNSVTLDASGTTDNVGVQTYEWDFDGDGTYEKTTSTASVTHSYGSSGDYTATVRVTDGGGNTDTAQVTISVSSKSNDGGGNNNGVGPTASLSAGAAASGETVTLDASDSTDNVGIETYEWDTDGDGLIEARTSSPTLEHTYGSAGTYNPSVTVVDDRGNTDTASVSVTVTEQTTASISVTNASVGSETITAGESATVSVTVENTGDAAGTKSINLTVDGETVASQSVDLSAGGSTTLTFAVSRDEAGEYTVSADGTLAGTVTVEAATTEAPTETNTTGTPTESPGETPTDTPQETTTDETPADETPTDTPDESDGTPTDTPDEGDETPSSTPTETPPPTTTVAVTETTTTTAGTTTNGTAPATTVTESGSATTDDDAEATATSTPGFTGALGVIALLGAGLVALRRRA